MSWLATRPSVRTARHRGGQNPARVIGGKAKVGQWKGEGAKPRSPAEFGPNSPTGRLPSTGSDLFPGIAGLLSLVGQLRLTIFGSRPLTPVGRGHPCEHCPDLVAAIGGVRLIRTHPAPTAARSCNSQDQEDGVPVSAAGGRFRSPPTAGAPSRPGDGERGHDSRLAGCARRVPDRYVAHLAALSPGALSSPEPGE